MLVCIGQTPGYSMCSQTTVRAHGFSRSFYVLLQLLLTAFVSPMGAAQRRPVAGHLLTEHPQTFPGETLVSSTKAPERCCTCLVVTAALSRGCQVLYSEHSPSLKNLGQQKF